MGDRGARLREAVEADYELDASELALLEETCRVADLCDELRAAVEAVGTTSEEGLRLLRRLERARAEFRLGLRSLNLPGASDELTPRAKAAQKAAQARWARGVA